MAGNHNRSTRVTESHAGRYQQTVQIGHHHLLADEPASMGGDDSGPAPYEYLMAGLGACTAMTLRMYAERKGLALSGITVTVDHEKVDAPEGPPPGQKVDRFIRRIALTGELTAEQRTRLLEIANRCPVHRTLSGQVQIDSALDLPENLQGSAD